MTTQTTEYYLMLYTISGTNPEKETRLSLWKPSIDSFKRIIHKIINDIYQENTCNDDDQKDLDRWIKLVNLHDIKHSTDLDLLYSALQDLSECVRLASKYAHNQRIDTYQKFNVPPEATLIFIDTASGYDFHYYIEWQQVPTEADDPVEFIIHDH